MPTGTLTIRLHPTPRRTGLLSLTSCATLDTNRTLAADAAQKYFTPGCAGVDSTVMFTRAQRMSSW